jgi:hypothetical protein
MLYPIYEIVRVNENFIKLKSWCCSFGNNAHETVTETSLMLGGKQKL